MKLSAKWTDDCQGKKDFDGPIVEIRTRYWPAGGGFSEFNSATGEWKESKDRPQIKPSANSHIVIRGEDDEEDTLVEMKFEADDADEVMRQVEAWAQDQYIKIVAALKLLFSGNG